MAGGFLNEGEEMVKANELNEVIAERDSLRMKLEEKNNKEFKELNLGHIQKELRQIKEKASAGSHYRIPYKEVHDHKNVSLWTREGKRIGPIHPESLEETWNRFYQVGIVLLAKQPTQQEIEDYKSSDEFKIKDKEFQRKRALKLKSKKPEQFEKLIKQMAEMTGMTVQALNRVIPQDQVKNKKGEVNVAIAD